MADFETKVRISAKTQGFDKVAAETAKLTASQAATTRGFAAASKAATGLQASISKALKSFDTRKAKGEVQGLNEIIGELEDQLSGVAAKQLEVQRAILSTGKGTPIYKKLTEEMAKLDDESNQVAKSLGLVERAFRGQAKAAKEAADNARQASGAFRQGFAQGSGMGEYMQRGPGQGRQMAGRLAGRAAVGIPMGVGGGLASTPFTGSQGLAQGLAAIPFAGALAGPLQAAMGFSGQALSYQRQQLDLAPSLFSGRGGGVERAPAVDQGANAARVLRARQAVLAQSVDVETDFDAGYDDSFRPGTARGRSAMKRGAFRNAVDRARIANEEGEKERVAIASERRRDIARAADAPRRRIEGDISSAGMGLLGVGTQESMAFAGRVSQIGGGGAEDLMQSGLLRSGMAAKTAFGVDEGVTGTLLSAQRRGGVVGGVDESTMSKLIGDAMSIGLAGSEVTEYLQQMSEGIEQWRQTGIPLNTDTIRNVGAAFGGTGIGAVQGQRVGKGVTARAQQIAMGGPEGAMDMMLMQAFGGFKGGGIEEFHAAKKEMASGEITKEKIQALLSLVSNATGGGAAGAEAFQSAFRSMGVAVDPESAERLLAAGSGGPQSPEQEAAVAKFQADIQAQRGKAPGSAGGLEAMAAGDVGRLGPNLRQKSAIEDQQLAVGKQLATAVLTFAGATTKAATAFGVLAGPIESIAKEATKVASLLPAFTAWLADRGTGDNVGVR